MIALTRTQQRRRAQREREKGWPLWMQLARAAGAGRAASGGRSLAAFMVGPGWLDHARRLSQQARALRYGDEYAA